MDAPAMLAILDASERHGIAGIEGHDDRRLAIAGRAFLRLTLARYLGVPPAQIPVSRANSGRPEIGLPVRERPIHVSLSASGNLVALAVTEDGPVGVDVEPLSGRRFSPDLADVVLSEREERALEAIPEEFRLAWLVRTWVAKEAVLKALGVGLSVPPQDVDVALHPVDAWSGPRDEWRQLARPSGWWARDLAWHGGCVAVAVADGSLLLRRFAADLALNSRN
jgi:4'-phosphopantetheinyl transferase